MFEPGGGFREKRGLLGDTSSPAYAALDLGTSNCRLLVASPSGSGFRVLDSFSRVVRLGEGLQQSDSLCPQAMERALGALHGCAERIARRPVRGVRAIATEACRRAVNGPAFLARVRRETGLQLQVITAREEAEIALESCAPLLQVLAECGHRRGLLLDIGGGSTELVWVRLPQPAEPRPGLIGTISLPIGVIDVGEAWARAGAGPCIDEAGFEATVEAVADALRGFDRVHRIAQEIRRGGVALVGTSGTVTTLAGVALELTRYRRQLVDGVLLEAREALAAVRKLQALGAEGIAAHPCVGAERTSFVLPGCAIFTAIHRVWPAERVMVADRGLREGLLLRMMRDDAGRARRRAQDSFRSGAVAPVP
jgi:exopolyphosphatase/guanosine-5'-triphosphate,3'-diphosphate pyrophosphatase